MRGAVTPAVVVVALQVALLGVVKMVEPTAVLVEAVLTPGALLLRERGLGREYA